MVAIIIIRTTERMIERGGGARWCGCRGRESLGAGRCRQRGDDLVECEGEGEGVPPGKNVSTIDVTFCCLYRLL